MKRVSRFLLLEFMLIFTVLLSVPALATQLEVTYSSPNGLYSPAGFYNSCFGNDVMISYSITGNESPVLWVQVMVKDQEETWTYLGSSASGAYNFTPAYFTQFLPYFLVAFEDHSMLLFYADDYLLSWATQEQYNEFEGNPIEPAVSPGTPYQGPGTHLCTRRMCRSGECVLQYIYVLAGEPCTQFPNTCDTDDDC